MSINISRNQLEYTMSQFNEMLECHIIEMLLNLIFLIQ